MGVGSSKEVAPVVASCPYPPYSLRMLGYRHVLTAGGGGAAKTGVGNRMDVFLLSSSAIAGDCNEEQQKSTPLVTDSTSNTAGCVNFVTRNGDRLIPAVSVCTESRATMNLDVAAVDPQLGVYRIAAGQDDYCAVYTTEFDAITRKSPENAASYLLTFKVAQNREFRTDFHEKSAYQKAVRFDPTSQGRRLVTAGADGHFRIWDAVTGQKVIDVKAHNDEVDDVDISSDGTVLITVGRTDAKCSCWSMASGAKLADLPLPGEQLGPAYRVRSVRFTKLGRKNLVLVAALTPIQQRGGSSKGKQRLSSHLALLAFNSASKMCNVLLTKPATQELLQAISTLAVSDEGDLTAIGTMSGGVGVYDTHELRLLRFFTNTHGIFVTGLQFVPSAATDLQLDPAKKNDGDASNQNKTVRRPISGFAAHSRATVLSISADQTIQLHTIPFAETSASPVASFLLFYTLLAAVLYLILWLIMRD